MGHGDGICPQLATILASAVDEVESMNELAGACLDDGRYSKWDGKEIYYRGEEKAEPYQPLDVGHT